MANQFDFIGAGIRIFGLHGAKNGLCDCGNPECKALFKHPIASNWQHTPDWSDEQLDTMQEMGQFDTGYGVLVNGLLVVDVDARNGGVESFNSLCKDLSLDLVGESGLAVSTGSGGGSMHLYFKCEAGAYSQHLDKYKGIDFKTSGYVVGPESLHASGNTYEVMHGAPDKITQSPAALLELLKKPDTYRASTSVGTVDVSAEDVKAALEFISPDCDYETWIKCGMAINHTLNGDGFSVWDDWSKNGKKYPGFPQLERHWHSFGKSSNPVTLGTLIHYAEKNGYKPNFNVEFKSDLIADYSPLDIKGIDLKRPPGFTGELAHWINTQCFYPRENLSVAAAINAVGSIGGLRYIDDINGFTANLYTLCVAGSSTGKEAIQQAYAQCLRAAGVESAMHGGIKSEQEIIRNLLRHQASYYCIDEFGIVLRKIVNAASKSGAAYLEGVIGLLMSVYSKGCDYLPISGDLKEFLLSELKNEAAACRKTIENKEDTNGYAKQRLEQIEFAMEHASKGIKEPLVSLIGFTTPVTFNSLISFEMATNGFISRAMIFDEHETNPKPNKNISKSGMPDHIKYQLAALYKPGEYNSLANERIENYGEKTPIQTTDEAVEALKLISEHFWNMAEDAKENGLEAIPRRGYELAAKVSFILAIPEGIRTIEHVRWAFALAKSDIERKMRLAYSNMNQEDDPANSIAAKIQNTLTDAGEPIGRGVLINKCRPAKRDAVEKIIDELVKKKMIEEVEGARKSKKYQLNR
jgi:hypothetical protein